MPKKTDISSSYQPDSISQIPRGSLVQDTFGWTVPVEQVPLPSGGTIYPVSSPLHGRDVLQIKAMTAQEEDILLSRALIKEGTVLTHLIKSFLIDKSIDIFNKEDIDLFTNVFPRTFPKGQSIEIIKSKVFLDTYKLMKTKEQLEHVTVFFYENNKNFKILNLNAPEDYSDVNLCIDNPDDIDLLEKVLKKTDGDSTYWKDLADSYRNIKSDITI